MALWGLPMVAIGVVTMPAVGYVGFVVIGIGNAVLDVGAITLVARLVPPTMLGRAFAAFEVVLVLGVTTGSLAAGTRHPRVRCRALTVAHRWRPHRAFSGEHPVGQAP